MTGRGIPLAGAPGVEKLASPSEITTPSALCVLDVNWDSTLQLFRALGDRVPLYLVKPTNFGQARATGVPIRSCLKAQQLSARHYLRRLAFPPGWFSALAPVTLPLLAACIRREMLSLGLRLAGSIITYPQYLPVLKRLRPVKAAYYCVDDYRCYWPDRAAKLETLENQVVAEVDLVVCTAKFMQEEFKRRVPRAAAKIQHLPNGTRESFLAPHPLLRPDPLPQDISHIPRPVLGYLGSISGRINWNIVERVLERFPSASVLLVGAAPPKASKDWTNMAGLRRFANFHYVGFRDQERIMTYIRAFDICLIPEPDEPLNVAGCPQKLWNYLASSRPIVSTRIPEQAMWEPAVSIADNPSQFCDQIARLLAAGCDDGLGARRLQIVQEHTWPRLAEQLWGALIHSDLRSAGVT
jgi:glycosyltransferase involved in cell wall biosynthesis